MMLFGLLVLACQDVEKAPELPPMPPPQKAEKENVGPISLEKDFSAHFADTQVDFASKKEHSGSLSLGTEGEIDAKVFLTVVQDQLSSDAAKSDFLVISSAQFVESLRLEIPSGTGYNFSIDRVGNPVNKGTPEMVMMSIPVIVKFTHKDGRKMGSTMFHLNADGSIEVVGADPVQNTDTKEN